MRVPVAFVVRDEILKSWHGNVPKSARDVDLMQDRFRRGENNWIVQGYALLREELERAGFEVSLTSRFPRGAIAIAHRDALNSFAPGAHLCRLIGVRADRPPLFVCERVVVQNNIAPDSHAVRFIPHWPQPGLVPRESQRGTRLETIAYMGRIQGAARWMRSDAFRLRLAGIGVRLQIADRGWNDYHGIDAVLSAREAPPAVMEQKPGSKLANAWLARVPALLGDEPAFRALRLSELDYLPVDGPDATVAAIQRLKMDPGLYTEMVANGIGRSIDFTREAITRRWLELIAELARTRVPRRSWARYAMSMVRQKIEARRFRDDEVEGSVSSAPA